MSNEYLYILIISNILFFGIGFLFGKTINNNPIQEIKPKSIFDKNSKTKKSIEIDDKKFVTAINTNKLEKKYIELGEKQQSTENISSTVNKLKNMKGT